MLKRVLRKLKRRLWTVALIVSVTTGVAVVLVLHLTPAGALSTADYNQLESHFSELVRTQDPGVALQELDEQSKLHESVLRSCHQLVHAIGHEAYEKYGDVAVALSFRNEVCGAGYVHGVIETYIETVGYSKTRLADMCNSYTIGPDRANCYHGAGHGLMYYSGNDVPVSLAACDSLPQVNDRLRCSEGVFMENFESDEIFHPSEFVDGENSFGICRAQSKSYQKGTCYFYAPHYYLRTHPSQYQTMFEKCITAEPAFVSTCIKGTASRVAKENTKRISYLDWMCSKQKNNEMSCAEGLGSYHYTQYGDAEKTRDFCSALRPAYHSACTKTLKGTPGS